MSDYVFVNTSKAFFWFSAITVSTTDDQKRKYAQPVVPKNTVLWGTFHPIHILIRCHRHSARDYNVYHSGYDEIS